MVDVITKLFEVGLLILILCNRNTDSSIILSKNITFFSIHKGRVVFLETANDERLS